MLRIDGHLSTIVIFIFLSGVILVKKIYFSKIFLFRLEEGKGPDWTGRAHMSDSWELMEKYYEYLRNRDIKYFV